MLRQLDGRAVNGKVLQTAGAGVVEIPMIPREKLFQMLWRPEVMMILMLVAIYGIIGELSNPGAILPGVVGAIALILVLYMSTILPVNVAGLALIAPGVGVVYRRSLRPHARCADLRRHRRVLPRGAHALQPRRPRLPALAGLHHSRHAGDGGLFPFCRRRGPAGAIPARAGRQRDDAGPAAVALARIDSSGGKVFVEGEYWNAVSEAPVEPGQPVEIVGIDGLTLKVKPKQDCQLNL